MNNYELLEKHRKKLSVHFALFILFSIWTVVWFFELSIYISETSKDNKALNNKIAQITNVIENRDLYKDVQEVTFKKVINQIFKDSVVITDSKIIISKIDDFDANTFPTKLNYTKIWWYKYLEKDIFENRLYRVIVRKSMRLTFNDIIDDYTFLLFFSIPFLMFFYLLWYIFVGKNLKPIWETIKNLEDFTWNINHEFKTPLSEIISSLSLAKKTWDYKEAIDQSIESTKKINDILNSLIWLVNITDSAYKKQKINIVNLSKEIIKSYNNEAKKKNIKINFKTNSKVITKKLNKDHFSICIWNILSNAIKYSGENSKIDISIKWNIIEIKDFWEWIEKKNMKKIFDRYFRETYIKGWSGVGLSLVKKISDINKWEIKIKSRKMAWTKVVITI